MTRSGPSHHNRTLESPLRWEPRDPKVGALRQRYGDSFAAGARANTLLSTVLKRECVDTLSQLLMKGSVRR
jgi:hypothetical protein